MEILGAVLHAVSLARGGARVAGHPLPGLEDAHAALAPIRARQNAENGQEIGQSFSGTEQPDQGTEQPDQGTDAEAGDGGADVGASDIGASDAADSGGVLDFLGDAVDWIADWF